MSIVMLAAVCLALSCAADPPSDNNWVAPTPGSAPEGSPVALHGQLQVVSDPVVDLTGSPGTDADEPVMDADEPVVDAGSSVMDAGRSGSDAGKPGVDAAVKPAVHSQLVDQRGAPFQLKGVSSHWLQWESQHYAESKSALAYMRDNWKVSVIRAAMGTDQSGGYLQSPVALKKQVETIIHNAIDLGVYVLVDWHTEQAVSQQDEAVAFFTEMATKYGAYPNVIWEPYNEPNGPAWSQIKTYHQAVVNAVRKVDPDNLMVLGTPNWSQRVDQAAADPVTGTNLLYTLHWYSCTHGQSFRDYGNTAIAKGIALFVTEFGATDSNGGANGDYYVCEDEANLWFAWMSQNDISGVAWKLDQGGDASCILSKTAPLNGPWTDDKLTSDVGGELYTGGINVPGTAIKGGHGQFVVNWIRQ